MYNNFTYNFNNNKLFEAVNEYFRKCQLEMHLKNIHIV